MTLSKWSSSQTITKVKQPTARSAEKWPQRRPELRCQPCSSGEQLASPIADLSRVTFLCSLVGNALSVLLITLVMRVLVDIPLAALLSQVAIAG
jgi:hypothetical protein